MTPAPDPAFTRHLPHTALVLGSGLGHVVEDLGEVLASRSFRDAGLPASTVPGHEGWFLLVRGAGPPLLLMQGRVHLYEGHPAAAVTAGVRWLAAQGVRTLLLTNAAGSLNPAFAPGSWMMLDDHLNLTGASPLTGGPHFQDLSEVYARRLREEFHAVATAQAITLHEGVYAGVPGPHYETPAEIRMLQRLGADAVGMSTVLEAIQARALGLEVAAFSCLTNWGAGLAPAPLDHGEVVAAGREAGGALLALVRAWLGEGRE